MGLFSRYGYIMSAWTTRLYHLEGYKSLTIGLFSLLVYQINILHPNISFWFIFILLLGNINSTTVFFICKLKLLDIDWDKFYLWSILYLLLRLCTYQAIFLFISSYILHIKHKNPKQQTQTENNKVFEKNPKLKKLEKYQW